MIKQKLGKYFRMSIIFHKYAKFEDCPDAKKHTKSSEGYIARSDWMDRKSKRHNQEQCPTCGFWVIWKRKSKEKLR